MQKDAYSVWLYIKTQKEMPCTSLSQKTPTQNKRVYTVLLFSNEGQTTKIHTPLLLNKPSSNLFTFVLMFFPQKVMDKH